MTNWIDRLPEQIDLTAGRIDRNVPGSADLIELAQMLRHVAVGLVDLQTEIKKQQQAVVVQADGRTVNVQIENTPPAEVEQ